MKQLAVSYQQAGRNHYFHCPYLNLRVAWTSRRDAFKDLLSQIRTIMKQHSPTHEAYVVTDDYEVFAERAKQTGNTILVVTCYTSDPFVYE